MRKLLLLALVTLLASTALSVSAFDDADMTAPAAFIEDDALMFASIRTDDSLISSLDSLIERVEPFLPQGTLPPNMTTTDLLNLALQDANVGTFEEAIRPWLGDVASIAVYSPESFNEEPTMLVAVEVDGEAALTFIEGVIANELQSGSIETVEENGFTIFVNQFDPTRVAIGDDVLFIATSPDILPLEAVSNPLSADSNFNATVNALPEDSYGILLYMNMQKFQELSLMQAGMGASGMPAFLEDFMNVYRGMAMGFTILNEEALIMDMVQVLDNSVYEQFGVETATDGALDTNFTNHIPADAFAALQIADFGSNMQLGLKNIRVLGDYIKANGGLADMIDPQGFQFSDDERLLLNQVDLAWFVGAINLAFAGGTGLNLERDVLPVLDGDIAMYLSASPAESFIFPVAPNAAILLQNNDADAAVAIVEQLAVSAEAYELPVLQEDYGNGKALVVPAEEYLGFPSPVLDILVGSSDDVFAIGTRGGVNAIVDMEAGLTDNPSYQNAAQYFVPDSQIMLYLASEPLLDAADILITSGNAPVSEVELQMGYPVISLLESASITGSFDESGVTVVRFVINLSDEPRPLPQVPDA